MSVSALELLHAVTTVSNTYSQLDSADAEYNDEVISTIASGDTHPRFISVNGGREAIPMSTKQLATVLAECGLQGVDVSPAQLYYRKVDNLDGRVAHGTLEHTKLRAELARMYVSNITAGHRQEAMARCRIVPVYDGTNSVLVRTTNNAITSLTPTTAESFVLGPISNAGTKIEGCDGLDIAFNDQQFELADESTPGTTFSAGDTISPVISFTSTSITVAALHRTAVTNFRVHLLRKERQASTYADAATQHIRFTVDAGLILVRSITGRPAEKRVEVYCSGDDGDGFSDAPMSIAVNVAVALS